MLRLVFVGKPLQARPGILCHMSWHLAQSGRCSRLEKFSTTLTAGRLLNTWKWMAGSFHHISHMACLSKPDSSDWHPFSKKSMSEILHVVGPTQPCRPFWARMLTSIALPIRPCRMHHQVKPVVPTLRSALCKKTLQSIIPVGSFWQLSIDCT